MEHVIGSDARTSVLKHGLRLEYLTVGWNVIEGLIAVIAALSAGSIALLGFGIDSFVESLSGGALIWRLQVEYRIKGALAVERIDRQAHRLVGISLFALAAWVTFDAIPIVLGTREA